MGIWKSLALVCNLFWFWLGWKGKKGSCLYSRRSDWSTSWDRVMLLSRHMDSHIEQIGPENAAGYGVLWYMYFPFRQMLFWDEQQVSSLLISPPPPQKGGQKGKEKEGKISHFLFWYRFLCHPSGIHLLVCFFLSTPQQLPFLTKSYIHTSTQSRIHAHAISCPAEGN